MIKLWNKATKCINNATEINIDRQLINATNVYCLIFELLLQFSISKAVKIKNIVILTNIDIFVLILALTYKKLCIKVPYSISYKAFTL